MGIKTVDNSSTKKSMHYLVCLTPIMSACIKVKRYKNCGSRNITLLMVFAWFNYVKIIHYYFKISQHIRGKPYVWLNNLHSVFLLCDSNLRNFNNFFVVLIIALSAFHEHWCQMKSGFRRVFRACGVLVFSRQILS